MDWVKKWLLDFNTGKTQLVWFDRSNDNCFVDVKMNGSVLEEKSSFKILGLTFSSKLDWGSYIISIVKAVSKKIGALIRSISLSFFLLKLVCISINLPYSHVWNTVVTSGLVPLIATWNCYISYRNEYKGLLVLHFTLVASLEPLVHRQNVAILSLFYRDYFSRCSSQNCNWLNWFHFLFL